MTRLGKWIDRAALLCMIGTGQFFYYRWATGKLVAALVLTAISLVALWKILTRLLAFIAAKRGPTRRARRQAAEAALSRLLYEPKETAEGEVRALLKTQYGEEPTVFLLQRYPSENPLSADEVLSVWRAHSGEKRLVLAATRDFSGEAESLAGKLENPKIALLGRTPLLLLCARHMTVSARGAKEARPKMRLSRLISRRRAKKQLLLGIVSLTLYLIFGVRTQLLTGLFLIALAALGFRRKAPPARLFQET